MKSLKMNILNKLKELLELPKRFELLLIRIYQKTLSLDHGYLGKMNPNLRPCKYTPTCSEYTYQAIEKYGSAKGLFLGFKRILRCHPWSKGGNEPLR